MKQKAHYGCCAWARQSGGAFAFALNFLLLFLSREKVNSLKKKDLLQP
jgi:hypothetical protein